MAQSALIVKFSDLRKRSRADACATAEPQEERKTMTVPQPRPRRRKPLDAGPLAPEIGSFRLHLAAEGKAAKTVRTYTEAVRWFAAAHLIPRTSCPVDLICRNEYFVRTHIYPRTRIISLTISRHCRRSPRSLSHRSGGKSSLPNICSSAKANSF